MLILIALLLFLLLLSTENGRMALGLLLGVGLLMAVIGGIGLALLLLVAS